MMKATVGVWLLSCAGLATGLAFVGIDQGQRAIVGAGGPIAACFDEKHPPPLETRVALEEYMRGFAGRYNVVERWSGTQGDPRALTWSLVPDGLSIPSGGSWDNGGAAGPSNTFAQMDAKFGGNRALWIAQVQAVFDRVEALTGVDYTRIQFSGNAWDDGAVWGAVGSANRGDIRVAMRNIDGAWNILAYNRYPSGGGDTLMDSSEIWGDASFTYRFFRNTLMHENGHGLGLAHVCPQDGTKLLEPGLNTGFDGLQQDELRALQRSYGDIHEPNNSRTQAVNIGTWGLGTDVTVGIVPSPGVANGSTICLDADSDQDWYKLNVAQPYLLSFTLAPVGSSYDDSDQLGNGSCGSGNVINARAMANVALRLFASNGTTLVFTADTAASGSNEVLNNVLVPAGDWYATVYETDTPTQSQLYTLRVRTALRPSFAASDGTFTDRIRLTWTTISGATGYEVWRNTTNNQAGAALIASPAVASYDDMAIVLGDTYWYWVKAVQGGGPARDVAPGDSGYTPPPLCRADYDGDGFVTGDDMTLFVIDFEAGDLRADMDGDGFITGDDFTIFVTLFEIGCP